MMGARTVVSGMRPEIAMTLEAMGVRLGGMSTVATLEEALEQLGIHSDQSETERLEQEEDAFFQELLREAQ